MGKVREDIESFLTGRKIREKNIMEKTDKIQLVEAFFDVFSRLEPYKIDSKRLTEFVQHMIRVSVTELPDMLRYVDISRIHPENLVHVLPLLYHHGKRISQNREKVSELLHEAMVKMYASHYDPTFPETRHISPAHHPRLPHKISHKAHVGEVNIPWELREVLHDTGKVITSYTRRENIHADELEELANHLKELSSALKELPSPSPQQVELRRVSKDPFEWIGARLAISKDPSNPLHPYSTFISTAVPSYFSHRGETYMITREGKHVGNAHLIVIDGDSGKKILYVDGIHTEEDSRALGRAVMGAILKMADEGGFHEIWVPENLSSQRETEEGALHEMRRRGSIREIERARIDVSPIPNHPFVPPYFPVRSVVLRRER